MIDTLRVQRSFARGFDSYDSHAAPQRLTARMLVRRLIRAGAPRQVALGFEIGCGTGQLTGELCTQIGFDRLVLNDLTDKAHATATRHGADFLPGDIRTVTWPERPDLIFSGSTLQWLEDPAVVIRAALDRLAPGGWLALSMFGPEQFRELRALGTPARAPGLCSAQTLADAARGRSLAHLQTASRPCRLWFDTPRDVLRHLRDTGVNAGAAAPWSRARLARFTTTYCETFGVKGRVPLTYDPVILIAQVHG